MPANIDHLNNAASAQDVANLIESRLGEISDQDLIDRYESYQDAVVDDVNLALVKFLQSMPTSQRADFIAFFNTEIDGFEIVPT